jgi:hypothetical protein
MRHLISPPMAVGRASYPVTGGAARPFRGLRLALLRPSRRVCGGCRGNVRGRILAYQQPRWQMTDRVPPPGRP